MSKSYYTVEDVSKMLQLHEKTVQRYIREGKLGASKVGKAWRINGHDLSLFVEGNKTVVDIANIKPKSISAVSISSVIDIDCADMNDGMRIVNMMTAALNAKPPEHGRSSMSAQFIEPESKVRIMLWGGIGFMTAMLQSIETMTSQIGEV